MMPSEVEAAKMGLGDHGSHVGEDMQVCSCCGGVQKQPEVWIPTKKGGHGTVIKCGYPGCFNASMSKAKSDATSSAAT